MPFLKSLPKVTVHEYSDAVRDLRGYLARVNPIQVFGRTVSLWFAPSQAVTHSLKSAATVVAIPDPVTVDHSRTVKVKRIPKATLKAMRADATTRLDRFGIGCFAPDSYGASKDQGKARNAQAEAERQANMILEGMGMGDDEDTLTIGGSEA